MSGAPLEVNVPHHIRTEVLEALKNEMVDRDCFENALVEVYAVLKNDSFPRFKKSEFYYAYRRTYWMKADDESVSVTSRSRCWRCLRLCNQVKS